VITSGSLWRRRSGNATEHFAKESWQSWHEEALQRGDLKACLRNELPNWPIEITATSDTALQRIAQILPPRYTGAIATTMFEKDIPAIALQHASHFMERPDDIGNGAQRPGRHHAVKGGAGKWQPYGGNVVTRDRYMSCGKALRYPFGQNRMGINSSE
jgi:hypothetical protein